MFPSEDATATSTIASSRKTTSIIDGMRSTSCSSSSSGAGTPIGTLASGTADYHKNASLMSTGRDGKGRFEASTYFPTTRRLSSSMSLDHRHSSRAPHARKCNDLSDFTINKLDYKSLHKSLYGRDKELKILGDCWDSLMMEQEQANHTSVVMISGLSGSGKTRLAEFAYKRRAERVGGKYVRGKFERSPGGGDSSAQPYSGLSKICAQLCGLLLELEQRTTVELSNSAGIKQNDEKAANVATHIQSTAGASERSSSCVSEKDESLLKVGANTGPHGCYTGNHRASTGRRNVSQRIQNDLGNGQLELLTEVFPILAEVIDVPLPSFTVPTVNHSDSGKRSESLLSPAERRYQVHFAFVTFVKSVMRLPAREMF